MKLTKFESLNKSVKNITDKRIEETYLKDTILEQALDVDTDDGFDLYYNNWLSLRGCEFIFFTKDKTYLVEFFDGENPDPVQFSSEEEIYNFLSQNELLTEFSVFQAACEYQLNKDKKGV